MWIEWLGSRRYDGRSLWMCERVFGIGYRKIDKGDEGTRIIIGMKGP